MRLASSAHPLALASIAGQALNGGN